LFSLLFVFAALSALTLPSANTAYAASEKVAEFHFWAVNAGSGTKTDNGITFSYSGVTAHEYETSKVSIASGGTLRITVAEAQLTENSIGKASFSIRVDSGIAINYNLKRGSTTLSSGSGKTSYDVGETSIAGSGDLVLEFTNNSGSTATGVHFEYPNYSLYALPKRSVSITAGTGVKSVYMSTSSTATSGDSSGTEYADDTTVYGFAKLDKGYSGKSGWTLVSGTANTENAIYRVGSKKISNSQKSFGTISADATSYTITYILNDGTLPSGYLTSYNITTNTFSLSTPTKTGYTFAGWTGSNGSTPQTSVSIAKGSTGNKSYTANWTANSYTVTLNKNNGTGGSNSVSATYGSAMPSATMPTRTGYTFSGYFDSNNVKYYNANGTSAKNWDKANATTLNAQWQINQYPVSCPANTEHASFFLSSSNNATSGVTSGNFDYNSTVYFYVVADEGYYAPDESAWYKVGTVGDGIVYRAESLTVGTDANNFSAQNPQKGADIVANATAYDAAFDKASHSINVNVTTPASGYVVKYKVGSGEYSTTIPQYTDVCSVTIDYKITADGYYPLTGSSTVDITRQENVSYTSAPAIREGLVYNGAAQALLTVGTSNFGTVQYKVGDEGEWTDVVPQVQNVGEYVVYYRVPEDANQVGISENSFTVFIAEVNKDDLNAVIDTSEDYYNSIANTNPIIAADFLNDISNAKDIRDNVNVTEGQVADATTALSAKLSDAKVAVTIENIGNIGEVEYTAESKEKIEAARNAYDILSEEEKQLIDNYTVLTDAENLYYPVDDSVKKIDAIGSLEYDTRTENAIVTARETYDTLVKDNAARRAIFPQDVYDALTDAEEAYRVMCVIKAIGSVKYTDESKALIEDARANYEALTEEQRRLVAVSVFKTLEDAETTYETTDKNAKTFSTVMNIILGVLLVAGIVVLILLLNRKNGKKVKGEKLMSVSALPLLLASNHYFDARFIILYSLAFLAVAVWTVDLILFLKSRKGDKTDDAANVAPIEENGKSDEVVKDSDSEDADSEAVTVIEENGVKFSIRRIKSFTAKLIQSDDEVKSFYGELKNEVLSYADTSSRVSWKYDSINCGRKPVLKFGIRGKTLCVYYALDIKELKASKYKVELCESKTYAAVPCMYRIKDARRCEIAKDLIATVAARLGLDKGERQSAEYSFPYEDNDALIKKGLIKEIKTRAGKTENVSEEHIRPISVNEADAQMTDEAAVAYIKEDVGGKTHKGKKGIINIDTISDNFNDGDTVDIEALWKKKLIPPSVGYVKVLARGSLGKKLDIDLQEYSIQAVKMIILEGGTVKKAK
jgi:uncharacterized repeat protein (TIGR02543 family)